METEPNKRSHSAHRKRRERAEKLQLEKFKSEDDSADDANGPNGVGKDKGRSRPRKKRTGAGTYEEDIIDGFAIVSFKTASDLEKFAAGKLSSKKNLSARKNNLMSPNNRHRNNNRENRIMDYRYEQQRNRSSGYQTGFHTNWPIQSQKQKPLPKIVKKPSNSLLNSEDSGENTDILDTTDLILNGPTRINNRRSSDVSTVSSSGAGYMCDSESGDEHSTIMKFQGPLCSRPKVSDLALPAHSRHSEEFGEAVSCGNNMISDASTDTFASPVNRSFNRDVIPGLQVSPSTTVVTTTVCMVTTTTSDITVTTVTTTTSCGTSTTSTTPVITTTTTPVVVNSNQHSYLPNNCHSHIANQHNSVNQQQLQPVGDKLQPVSGNQHKQENYPTAIQNGANFPLKRESSESFLTNHHKSEYLAGNLKSDNFVTGQHQPAGPKQHPVDSYQSSQIKKDSFMPNHYKSDNIHTSHNKSDSQQAGVHNYPAGVIHHKGPASFPRNDSFPGGHNRHENQSTSHHVSTSHLKSENSVDKQPNPNSVNNHHHYNSHHNNQYHHHQQQQQQQKQQHHHHHSSVSKEASQTLHRSHSEAIIRHHESSRQPSPSSLKRVPSPANLKRGHSSIIPPPPLTKSQPYISKPQPSGSVSSLPSSTVIREHKRTPPPPPAKTPRRDEPRERDSHQVLPPSLTVSKSPFLGLQGPHGSATPILYSPLGPSPGLPIPLHSTPSHSSLPGAPSISPLHPQPPTPNHNMFAPPMPLGPPAGPLGAATPAPPPPVIPDPDMLREELNRRFLASTQDRSVLQAMPGFLKADFHQHMHQHQHQHTHNHTYHGGLPAPPGAAPSPVVPPAAAAHMYDYRPGLPHRPRGHIAEPDPRHLANSKDKPALHPQHPASVLPGLSSYPSLLLNPAAAGPGAGPLGTPGLSGAFQPKNVSSLHAAHQLLMPLRDREKPGPSPQPALPGAKKPGKWCAAHVRIAWEIYNHQQKTSDKGPGDKMADPLRPPSHLLPGSMVQRGPEYPNSASTSGLGSGRGLFDASPHTLLGAPQLAPPFPRPSPYSIGTSLTLGSLGNGLVSTSREPAIPISSGSQEWNRLHRTPPTFPTPPAWATKTEDREKELERERSIERRREEERERERRLSIDDRHRFPSLDERSRDRLRDSEILMKSRSRSRSRSPVRNGRVDSAKLTDRRYEENPLLKIKEERREREDLMSAERDRLLKNEMSEREQLMKNEFLRSTDPFLQQASAMERSRMLMPGLLGVDRFQNPAAVWNPFDKGPLDFQNHRLSIPRDLEPNRNPLLTRFPHPGAMTSMAVLEQERLKEELLLRDERAKREYLDGLPLFERERLFYENSKIPTLRPPESLVGIVPHFPRTISPGFGHPSMIKRSSPAVIPGAPPPLIHTVNAPHNRGLNPAMMNKNKGVSPIDSVGESKCDSNSNSTDPDAHSR